MMFNICCIIHYRRGHLEVAVYLVEKCHCRINITDENKETLLHLACR